MTAERNELLAGSPGPTVAFFGHDYQESTIIKRARAFVDAGLQVVGFMYHRDRANRDYVPEWNNVDLGVMEDCKYLSRLLRIVGTVPRLIAERRQLRQASMFYARNLDMVLLALLARAVAGKRIPLVYEALDIHALFTRPGPVGRLFRLAERAILRQSAMLVVSAPEFVESYFKPVQGYDGPVFLLENKVLLNGARDRLLPQIDAMRARVGRHRPDKWIVSWNGTQRCLRSFEMIKRIAAALPDRVEFHLHGFPSMMSVEQLRQAIAPYPNIRYFGEYKLPYDLARIYGSADFSWSFDFYDAGANARWLLPNRLYEAPLCGVPALAAVDSATGRQVDRLGLGWTFDGDHAERIIELLRTLSEEEYMERRRTIASLPISWFNDEGDIGRLYDQLSRHGVLEPVPVGL